MTAVRTILALIVIAAYILLCSCSSIKNHYLKKYCINDTISQVVTIHDTIVIDSIQVDTIFDSSIDSIFIEKDKIQIQYIKKFGKIYIQGKCKADTIFYEKKVIVESPCNSITPSWIDSFMIKYKYPILVIFILLLLLLFTLLKK